MNYKQFNDYELLYMVRESDVVFDILINKYTPVIKRIAFFYLNQYRNINIDLEDLVQEGRIAIVYACNSYSDDKNVLFYTYLCLCIKRRIINYINMNYLKLKNKALNDYELIDDYCNISDYKHPLNNTILYELIIVFKNFSFDLSFDDSSVFILKNNGFSYKDISIILDIPIKKVDNSLLKINKKLKKYLLDLEICL